MKSPPARKRPNAVASSPTAQLHQPLRLEITKGYSQQIVQFLVHGMRQFPIAFAHSRKTHFIHLDLYTSKKPTQIIAAYDLCKLHTQIDQGKGTGTATLGPRLRQQLINLLHQFVHATSFEELLACAQALILLQCIVLLRDDQNMYSDRVSCSLAELGQRLWQQAPVQLPHTLSPRRAWIYAESVRRTIIVSFMLRSVYSLQTRNYSVRTPFIDSLPFDVRTSLWDAPGEAWADGPAKADMVSLHEYSGMLESGQTHDITPFGSLILAACRGVAISEIPSPAALRPR
ncbi:aflatoxin biosynthesis regulatory protein [Aspergillus udagawae]|uniref:Aflatoxin biosynthesis regulatory protein n=1 Tax=Aspergillus udagawae TaxID=91492 RepID=A0ABQ1AAH1_9EURO|nr:aflatoxin biosynthesis regulatory protein [Aspergillus udagawae]GFF55893.1 aflatoxin biosynthesis regulatory protein [Aspergillus udagawae]GFF77445.1 aflatoxin biosynthesis regulatory protein [Aspergillus udagawae]GFG17513.1 aflatoxin biosynthesis regulatory protein [Aspergillus udagawae]